MNNIKQKIYILLFTFLGTFFGFFIHMLLETFYINQFLLKEFTTYSFNLSWNSVLFLHALFTFILTTGFGVFGFYQGKYWWRKLYVEGGGKYFRLKSLRK